jgi:hypothetical protein
MTDIGAKNILKEEVVTPYPPSLAVEKEINQ